MSGHNLRLVLASHADADFDEIYLFTGERWGIEQAEEYAAALQDAFQTITRHPEIGQRRNDFGRGIRCRVVKEHAVWYRIEGDVVRVLRITHARVNPATIQFDDD
jgi:toxin ParE1/3/4